MRNGPSPYAIAVLRPLTRMALTVAQIQRATGFPRRRVLQQITWLRAAGACTTKCLIPPRRRAGSEAVYALDVIRI